MRKFLIFLGVLLLLGAAGLFAYRQLNPAVTEAAYRQMEEAAGERSRGFEPGPDSAREARRQDRAERGGRGGGNLRMFELLINVLNTAVGIVGIALWIMGSRMRREAQSQSQSISSRSGT